MKTYLHKIMAFINDEEGASAIEYGLLVGLIALAIIAAATALGGKLNVLFTAITAAVAVNSAYGSRGRSLRASAPPLRGQPVLPRA